jgi:hypothetical protein
MSSFLNCELGWKADPNLYNSTPFGKSTAFFVKYFRSRSKTIKTLSSALIASSGEDNKTFIKFNSSMNTSFA